MSAVLCPDPADRANGMGTFTGNSFDDTVTYTCITGFELIGNVSIMCAEVDMNSAAFSPAAPVCMYVHTRVGILASGMNLLSHAPRLKDTNVACASVFLSVHIMCHYARE